MDFLKENGVSPPSPRPPPPTTPLYLPVLSLCDLLAARDSSSTTAVLLAKVGQNTKHEHRTESHSREHEGESDNRSIEYAIKIITANTSRITASSGQSTQITPAHAITRVSDLLGRWLEIYDIHVHINNENFVI